MKPNSPRPESSSVLLLWKLAITFEARLAAELAEMNLTVAGFRLIGEVMQEPNGLRESELAHRLGISESTITETVSRMEIRDVLRREPDPDEPGAQRVYLAASANLILGIDVLSDLESVLLSGMDADDQHAVQDLLRRLENNLQLPE
ncbi:MAG: DNA-binding MarR family transcriptional regulator [Myxococcota bacterium]|jgi:DNA-binding MarR family transcriptional regulator